MTGDVRRGALLCCLFLRWDETLGKVGGELISPVNYINRRSMGVLHTLQEIVVFCEEVVPCKSWQEGS